MAGKFVLKDGRWVKSKSATSDVFFDVDFTTYLATANTTLSAILATEVRGVAVSAPARIEGNKVIVKLSGLDTAPGALNFCRVDLKCANTEAFSATLWFEQGED